MENDLFIAIDPGKKGGIAWRTADEESCAPMPDTVHELAELLAGVAALSASADCVLERVGAMPHDGPSRAFTFGTNFGQIQGVLATLKIPYRLVAPHTWQKKVGALPKEKAKRKASIKAFAQQRYPHLKVTLETSDALAMLAVEDE
jgi:crossover junction endodeoxyribonuclease RuvC